MSFDPDIDLAPYIDHSLLIPTATLEHVDHWCAETQRYGFASVCVYPVHVKRAVENLHESPMAVSTVIGFPTGADTSASKLFAAQEATENGATELDVVINLGWVKSGQLEQVHTELAQIVEATGQSVKAILEMALLDESEKRLAADVCMEAGVSFLKTSTGWHGGATVEDIRLLKQIARGRVGIKASGGIRTPAQAMALIEAGATRLGTSRGPDILRQRTAEPQLTD
ncbi:deoxyribose-phosphate aldolase [Leptolyngbya sp. Heron Island J]|uniref:deoxyribose-phosphate aldolase n=1 Tax=Leptolyngbya sp. Heron Island J TaxID=1385935 RepID=UPI0003B9738B|nr:deoxyribose-phosphate aldolase [Leptolyngbya sp. Heron Island J]ESA35482.1 deoxyribose-phosphate aldolase [Leptolyngbya sp. Heron Island J]